MLNTKNYNTTIYTSKCIHLLNILLFLIRQQFYLLFLSSTMFSELDYAEKAPSSIHTFRL